MKKHGGIINSTSKKPNQAYSLLTLSSRSSTAIQVINLLRERVIFPHEFSELALPIFIAPATFDMNVLNKKWNDDAPKALSLYAERLNRNQSITSQQAKSLFWETLEKGGYKPGQFIQILRLTLMGKGQALTLWI